MTTDDRYFFDAEAAEKPIRFIERYCSHTKAQHAGKKFILLPWQKDVIRQLYGTKIKATGHRRYRYLYLESCKCVGKSPLLAALGLYHMFVEKENSPAIMSCAANFKQASIIFDEAKAMIYHNDQLSSRSLLKQYEMLVPSRSAKWTIFSGMTKAASGFAPSLIIADEIHEYRTSDDSMLSFFEANLPKRHNSLMLLATNPGFDLTSPCGKWHLRAKAVLDGTSNEQDILPVIFSTSHDDPIGDKATWYKANPSLGHTVTVTDYEAEYARVKANPSKELYFRRLFLGQWVKSESAWLTPVHIAGTLVDKLPDNIHELPCYLGIDVGVVDDITAATWTWVDPDADQVWVKTDMWLPRHAAMEYQDRYNVPYYEWSQRGHINLTPNRTMDTPTKRLVADAIIASAAGMNVQQVCYDRYKADEIIFELEQAGMTCEPIQSTFQGIGQACKQIERRAIDGSLRIFKNDCLLWQLANVNVLADRMGNVRPVRPAASTSNDGTHYKKIDAVMALCYAMSRAYLHLVKPEGDTSVEEWDGQITYI